MAPTPMNPSHPALALAISLLAAAALAAPPAEIDVQGLYQGTAADAAGPTPLEARVVAQGDGNYRVLVRRGQGETLSRAELAATTRGDEVVVTGTAGAAQWHGTWAAGAIKGECGPGCTFEVRKTERRSPTLGATPPAGATVLLGPDGVARMVRANGSDWYLGDMSRHGWPVWEVPLRAVAENEPGSWPTPDRPLPPGWNVGRPRRIADRVIGVGDDGSIQVPQGGMNSADEFEGSFNLHVEFMSPFQPKEHSQGRGNSGCYMPNGDEIQVLDSFGECTYVGGCAGGFYHYHDPHCMERIDSIENQAENRFTLAANPPGTWQTYDIEYRVPLRAGQPAGKPRVTMLHNGIKIHDDCELHNDARKGGFHFQDHGNAVRYRNIWVLPVAAGNP